MLKPNKRTELEKELLRENEILKAKIKLLKKRLSEYENLDGYIDFDDPLWFLK